MAKRLAQVRAVELSEDVAKCAKSLEEHCVQARFPTRGWAPTSSGRQRSVCGA